MKKIAKNREKRIGFVIFNIEGALMNFLKKNMFNNNFLKMVCKQTKLISNGRYVCQLETSTQFGDCIYVFDNLSLIIPKVGYSTDNIKKEFFYRVLGYCFQQEELEEILFDEEGKQLKVKNAAKALIEAFKYVNVINKQSINLKFKIYE